MPIRYARSPSFNHFEVIGTIIQQIHTNKCVWICELQPCRRRCHPSSPTISISQSPFVSFAIVETQSYRTLAFYLKLPFHCVGISFAIGRSTFSLPSKKIRLYFLEQLDGKLYFRSISPFSHFTSPSAPVPIYSVTVGVVAVVALIAVIAGSVRAYIIPFSFFLLSDYRSSYSKWFILHLKWNWL